jgi:ABC-type bacteriocin/lantibiotic exporter with double-glycine peptidase domain
MVLHVTPEIAKRFTQPNDWSCGPTALRFLFSLYPNHFFPEPSEVALGTTPADGTSHDAIEQLLADHGVPYHTTHRRDLRQLILPCLVNYQWSGDGHYGVVIEKNARTIYVFNPGNGKVDRYAGADFRTRWFSRRYGSGWSLRLL